MFVNENRDLDDRRCGIRLVSSNAAKKIKLFGMDARATATTACSMAVCMCALPLGPGVSNRHRGH